MSIGDGVLPQYGNKYQMLTFVMCPGVNQVEHTTACVHGVSINSPEEYQLGISGQVTRLHGFHYDYRLNLLQDRCFFYLVFFLTEWLRLSLLKLLFITFHMFKYCKIDKTSCVVFMIVPDSVL